MSGGFIGVVVPLYLAECLSASNRGKGTAVFQWLLTLGIVAAALVGIYYSYRVGRGAAAGRCLRLFASRTRHGAASSGFRFRRDCSLCRQPHGDRVAALALPPRRTRQGLHARCCARALRAGHAGDRGDGSHGAHCAGRQARAGSRSGFAAARKYVIPFLLACVILSCNTGHGHQLGHRIQHRHSAAERLERSCLALGLRHLHRRELPGMTTIGMILVDRKGRKFLLVMGTSGIIVSMVERGPALQDDGESWRGLPRCCAGAVGPTRIDAALRCGRGQQAARGSRLRGQASTAIAHRSPSSTPTATLPRPQASCAPTMRRPRPSRSRARAAYRPTRSRR
jgi:MFS transporter, SP family, solute carrier family 2 (myo-inositol transporter), member 13